MSISDIMEEWIHSNGSFPGQWLFTEIYHSFVIINCGLKSLYKNKAKFSSTGEEEGEHGHSQKTHNPSRLKYYN